MCCEDKKIVTSDKAPQAIGPYSVGVIAGNLVYTAGQIGIDPAHGNLVEGGVETQTRQALYNLKNILEAAGTNLDNVVKTLVFLKDINDFAKMNAIYGGFFKSITCRSAVEVADYQKALVEIEAVAVRPS